MLRRDLNRLLGQHRSTQRHIPRGHDDKDRRGRGPRGLHRTGFAVGDRLHRELQRALARRDPQWGDLLHPERGPGPDRSLEMSPQCSPAPWQPGLSTTSSGSDHPINLAARTRSAQPTAQIDRYADSTLTLRPDQSVGPGHRCGAHLKFTDLVSKDIGPPHPNAFHGIATLVRDLHNDSGPPLSQNDLLGFRRAAFQLQPLRVDRWAPPGPEHRRIAKNESPFIFGYRTVIEAEPHFHGPVGARYTSFVDIMKKPVTVAGVVINAGKINPANKFLSDDLTPLYIYPVIAAVDIPIIHPEYLFLKGRRTRTVDTTFFSNVLVSPVRKRIVTDVSVLELKNPLNFRSPLGTSFLRISMRVTTPGDSA